MHLSRGCHPKEITLTKVAYFSKTYEGVSKSFRTGRLERELQMVQLSASRCILIAILWVSLVSFAAITLCVVSQRVFVFVVNFVITQSGNFWIYSRVTTYISGPFSSCRSTHSEVESYELVKIVCSLLINSETIIICSFSPSLKM
jgi:hypothetical protein